MYYEVILKTGGSLFFDEEVEADQWCADNPDKWEAVMVRGEFPDCWY